MATYQNGTSTRSKRLKGKVCLVTGASRGLGKGIAIVLGQEGATVYITGRTFYPDPECSGGSLCETAKAIDDAGGICYPVKCDHSQDEDVKRLFERITLEQHGRLDIVVNNAFSGIRAIIDNLLFPFWEQPLSLWDNVNDVGLRGYYTTTWHAARLMIVRSKGLIVNVSSGAALDIACNASLGIGKAAVDRMATTCARDLKQFNIAMVSIWPGIVRTEVTAHFEKSLDCTKELKEIISKIKQEDPQFTGRAIVALATDETILNKSGRILDISDLAREYGFTDVDGTIPISIRSLKYILQCKNSRIADYIPEWIRIPWWLISVYANSF
ncbi:Dehydrogenase/reductase SDR family member 1 [Trichoplax sp. H2]|nr:Dehydrogenase/reductase SDR family member 1 [Trichoplax sp. H2]|eukprot:RDD44104.1 Dehydrogenase/reductase SDR family member 1 [Trichoplax sp. H2]